MGRPLKIKGVEESNVCQDYINGMPTEELYKKYNSNSTSIWRLLKRNNIEIRKNPKLIKINENYFETIDSKDKAYWLGFITGDGYIGKNDYRLTLGLASIDKEILEKFKIYLESDHVICDTVKNMQILNQEPGTYYSSTLSFHNKKLHSDLCRHGVTSNKSKECNFANLPKNLMSHYCRGLMDSDGGWSIRKRRKIKQIACSFVSSIETFSFSFRNHLMEVCDLSDVKIQPNPFNTCYFFIYEGNIQCKRIYDYLYSDNGPWLDRKYNLTKNHFDNYNSCDSSQEIKYDDYQILEEFDKCDITKITRNNTNEYA